jgi:dTDP-4-amino-4,6-dideoxygalactose transaminase
MTKFVPLNPVLPAKWILGLPERTRSVGTEEGFLQGKQRIMTYSGSAALCAAARGLKQIDRKQLLAPSYNCGGEIEPFMREGFEVDVYRVDQDGCIDLSDLESRLRRSQQVVLVTHYFGFATELETVRSLCQTKGAYLLEDCAHAFMSSTSGEFLGAKGDLSIFSFKKSLPTPDGGCLILNNQDIPAVPPPAAAPFLPVYKKTVKLLMEGLFSRAEARSRLGYEALQIAKKTMQAAEFMVSKSIGRDDAQIDTPDINSLDFDSSVLDFRMSRRSLSLLPKIDTDDLKRRRRENYRYVQQALSDLKCLQPLFDGLPDGICPLKFPFVTPSDHPRAQEIMDRYPLVYGWWPLFHPSVPWDQFPESQWLKNNCFVIEIHQDMETTHLDFLVDQALKADKEMR